jgi:ketosteroid isomerase-like protein
MKKSWMFAALITMVMMSTPAAAFAKEQQPSKKIAVFVDEAEVKFEAAPVIEGGSALVPFKTIFEKLGFEVKWDAKSRTVTGKKANVTIELQIGSKTLIVNGQKKKLQAAPKIVKGVTLIPLRLVAEASDREVSWDAKTRTVFIASTEKQVLHVLQKNLAYMSKEDMAGVMATIHPESPYYSQMKLSTQQVFSTYDISYDLQKSQFLGVKDGEAAVRAVMLTRKKSGPEFKDNVTTAIHVFAKKDGEWKIIRSVMEKIDFLNQDQFKEAAIALSTEDQNKVTAVIKANLESSEKEDAQAMEATLSSDYPDRQTSLLVAQQLWAAFDFKVQVDNLRIIQGKDSEAKVRYTVTITKVKGPEFRNLKIDAVETVKKTQDGTWKIANSETVTQEYLD